MVILNSLRIFQWLFKDFTFISSLWLLRSILWCDGAFRPGWYRMCSEMEIGDAEAESANIEFNSQLMLPPYPQVGLVIGYHLTRGVLKNQVEGGGGKPHLTRRREPRLYNRSRIWPSFPSFYLFLFLFSPLFTDPSFFDFKFSGGGGGITHFAPSRKRPCVLGYGLLY